MTQELELGCRCGAIHGWLRGAAPGNVNRLVCYCDDCQAFLHYLQRQDLLDEQGGTDIVQVAPSAVTFDTGAEHIESVRLTEKGMYRWFAGCCHTPLGNTVKPAVPFIGMTPEVLRGAPDAPRRDEVFGPVRGRSFGQYARGVAPAGSTKPPWKAIGHFARLVIRWKLTGKGWPHPFFDRATGAPLRTPAVLSTEEREALRATTAAS